MFMIWLMLGSLILVLVLIIRYIVKTGKPKKPVPVCKHAVWPLPPDRPGVYVNDEPTVYVPVDTEMRRRMGDERAGNRE